ncbi:MAG: TRAP transporter small permease [Phyllobacteriaceae bacterium]|nr:TRAP transporter small permease [Phyllobacteriaceae bacterium]
MSDVIAHIESIVGRVLLATMVGLVFIAGVTRWFGHPLVWSMDVAQLLFVWAAFLGADMAMRKRGLIAVDLFVRWVPARHRVFIDLAVGLFVLAFLLALAKLGYDLVMLNREREFGDSGISYALVTAAVPIGCLLLATTLAGQLWETARSIGRRPQLVFSNARPEEVDEALGEGL